MNSVYNAVLIHKFNKPYIAYNPDSNYCIIQIFIIWKRNNPGEFYTSLFPTQFTVLLALLNLDVFR